MGGLGWLSTVDYYAEICRRSERRSLAEKPDALPAVPEIIIESLELAEAVSRIGDDRDEGSWALFDEYHRAALGRLEASGADFALIASNTPHHRFDAIVRGVGIPVLHIADAIAGECLRLGGRQLLLLGTSVTMGSGVLRQRFARRGVEAAGPLDDRARELTEELIAGLQAGHTAGAAAEIGRLARTSFDRRFTGPPFVALACTELPLAFPERKAEASFQLEGVTYVNSSAAHVAAAVDLAFAGGRSPN